MNDNRVFVSVYGDIVRNNALNKAISSALSRLRDQGKPIERFTASYIKGYVRNPVHRTGRQPADIKGDFGSQQSVNDHGPV